jgi:hypothetical protein
VAACRGQFRAAATPPLKMAIATPSATTGVGGTLFRVGCGALILCPASHCSNDLTKWDEQVIRVRIRTTVHHQTPVTEDQPQPSFWLLCLSTDVERSVALIGT